MTAAEVFDELAPLVGPVIEAEFRKRDLCILATRVAIEAARYYGVAARAMPVCVLLYNAAFASHIGDGHPLDVDCRHWKPIDGSHSVGVGFGDRKIPHKWNGHLIAAADGYFGDFGIRQAERLQHGIVTGEAITGPLPRRTRRPPHWKAVNEHGTTIEYEQIEDMRWKLAPDWRDEKRRRPLVAEIIRRIGR